MLQGPLSAENFFRSRVQTRVDSGLESTRLENISGLFESSRAESRVENFDSVRVQPRLDSNRLVRNPWSSKGALDHYLAGIPSHYVFFGEHLETDYWSELCGTGAMSEHVIVDGGRC